MKHRSVLTLLLALFASPAVAQDCPDVGSIPVPERLLAGPSTPCGIGLEITVGGVTYTSQQGFCPSFVMIMPRHAVPATARRGYRYVPAAPRDVLIQAYHCYGWIWTACRATGPAKVVNAVDNYTDQPCRDVHLSPPNVAGAGS